MHGLGGANDSATPRSPASQNPVCDTETAPARSSSQDPLLQKSEPRDAATKSPNSASVRSWIEKPTIPGFSSQNSCSQQSNLFAPQQPCLLDSATNTPKPCGTTNFSLQQPIIPRFSSQAFPDSAAKHSPIQQPSLPRFQNQASPPPPRFSNQSRTI